MKGVGQVFSSNLALWDLSAPGRPVCPDPGPTRLVASFTNGNDTVFNSRISLFNPSPSAGDITVRVFTLPLGRGTAQELTTTPLELELWKPDRHSTLDWPKMSWSPWGSRCPIQPTVATWSWSLRFRRPMCEVPSRSSPPAFLRHLSAAVIYSYRISLHWNHSAKSLS